MAVETEYSKKLKDPRWQKLRLKVFERDEFTCQSCGDSEETLTVHHLVYIKGREPWEYEIDNFLTLCQPCHQQEYENRPENENLLLETLKEKGFLYYDLQSLAIGFHHLTLKFSPEVTAVILEYALSHSDFSEKIYNEYFKILRERKECTQQSITK